MIYIVITCMVNYFYWILMILYFFTYIVVINDFMIDTNNGLYISSFLQNNEYIKWTFGLTVDTRRVWISYNIISVWYIQTIWFATADVWVNSITSPLCINVWHLPSLFPHWQRKHHNYLFYFCKLVPQYNHEKLKTGKTFNVMSI